MISQEITDFLVRALAFLPSAKRPWNFQGALGFERLRRSFWGQNGPNGAQKPERRVQFWAWELAVSKNQRYVQSFQPNCREFRRCWKSWYMKVVSKWLDFTFWSCSYFGRALDLGLKLELLRKKFLPKPGRGWYFSLKILWIFRLKIPRFLGIWKLQNHRNLWFWSLNSGTLDP